MIGLTLRIISAFTGNVLNTLVILGLCGTFYINQAHPTAMTDFNKEAAFSEVRAAFNGGAKGKPQKLARKTSAPKIIHIR